MAQVQPEFVHLDMEALSIPAVSALEFDEFGFLWIGTVSGLVRYDGVTYRHYRTNPEDSTTIDANYVKHKGLLSDGDGSLWVLHNGMVISRLDLHLDSWVRYDQQYGWGEGLENMTPASITKDAAGVIWVTFTSVVPGNDEVKLARYNARADAFLVQSFPVSEEEQQFKPLLLAQLSDGGPAG